MVDVGTTTEFSIRNIMAPMTGSKQLSPTTCFYGPPIGTQFSRVEWSRDR